MSNPNLTVAQLNNILVPKELTGKTKAQQDVIINKNGAVRYYLFNLYYNLQAKATSRNPLLRLPRYFLNTSTGSSISLTARQQVGLFNFIKSSRSSGLAYVIHKALMVQQRINLWRGRAINNPT